MRHPISGPAYERAFRAVFDRLGQRPGLIYDPFFLQGVAEVPDLTQPDGLHPNAAGVRKIVQRILPLVERLLAEVRNHEAVRRAGIALGAAPTAGA